MKRSATTPVIPEWINSRHNPEPNAVKIHVTEYSFFRWAVFFAGLAIAESLIIGAMWFFGLIHT